jgi:thioesterase domain-containing protein
VPAPTGEPEGGAEAGTDDAGDLAHIVTQIEQHYGTALDVRRADLVGLDEAGRYSLIIARLAERQLVPPGADGDPLRGLLQVYQANMRAVLGYRPAGTCAADITLLASESMQPELGGDPSLGWAALTTGQAKSHPVPGDHLGMLQEPHARTVAAQLAALLNEA